MAKRIVTHKQPDGDALAATWLAERFLFAGEVVEITFVSRGTAITIADCVVDVGNEYAPDRLRFDHKPPAFTDRNQYCATRLLWNYLCERGDAVDTLSAFISIVHEGDANPPRSPSPELRQSRTDGYHACISQVRKEKTSDFALYEAVREWLDARYIPTPTSAPDTITSE